MLVPLLVVFVHCGGLFVITLLVSTFWVDFLLVLCWLLLVVGFLVICNKVTKMIVILLAALLVGAQLDGIFSVGSLVFLVAYWFILLHFNCCFLVDWFLVGRYILVHDWLALCWCLNGLSLVGTLLFSVSLVDPLILSLIGECLLGPLLVPWWLVLRYSGFCWFVPLIMCKQFSTTMYPVLWAASGSMKRNLVWRGTNNMRKGHLSFCLEWVNEGVGGGGLLFFYRKSAKANWILPPPFWQSHMTVLSTSYLLV